MPGRTKRDENNQPTLETIIPLSQAADISGYTQSHLRLLINKGELWGKKVGRDWFTTESAVREYKARDHRPGPKPKKKQN
jgi:hypothetical protein